MKFSIIDKIIRIVIGISGLLIYATQVFHKELLELSSGILGIVALTTVLFDFCPIYYIFGIKKTTVRKKKQRFY